MNNVLALVALLLVYGTGTVKAQSLSSARSNNKTINFIDNISFTPEVTTSLLLNISAASINTTEPVKSMNEVMAEPADFNIEKISTTQFKYAMMMDVEVETLTNTTLYSFIDDWYGTHYRMGGTTKKGIDCSAFSGTLLSSIYSFDVPRTAREQYKICEHLKKDELLPGDLVFFNTRGGVSHVGVYLTNNYFVHSSSTGGVKISSLDEAYYTKTFISGGRVNQ